ncbi:hypothetical protein N7468_004249 [Penicillium chermesinum]|uniref:RING-type domain-containing protein n=1 Tax=Penicillium chermesinum TaxID=63820 RepID=A0A9W9P848_9EURO|nr:uncharacterized protein N7468_004249 [Penicillium chermesinum]KAJ5239630.1 hypothetical protein N7468_004249 [Penicillium chermesinum]
MRPPRLLVFLFCLIFFPIFLTLFSALSSSHVATPSTLTGPASGLHALFSFNIPTSLFPPSAIISLTDDNSTFFLARPAAFGPLLPSKGLSGQIWVGSGFGEGGLAAGTEGELGCSDIPGWSDTKQETVSRGAEQKSGKSGSGTVKEGVVLPNSRSSLQHDISRLNDRGDFVATPSSNDGTDDHLHHPCPSPSTHADIQSLQETAEIQGKVVLLSRGGCGFLEKVKWAQRRGAVALIVGDDTRGGSLVTMYARGDTSNVTIPALFTSHTTAHLLSSLIPGHSSANADLGQIFKSLQASLAGQTLVDVQKATATATPVASATPTPISSATQDEPIASTKSSIGFFRKIGSLFGLCNKLSHSGSEQHGQRSPGSGNLELKGSSSWSPVFESRVDRSKISTEKSHGREGKAERKDVTQPGLETSEDITNDDFVIGVQDWRDPDVMLPRSSLLPTATTSVNGKDTVKTSTLQVDALSSPNVLRGGSITPGSGEYQSIDKSTGKFRDTDAKEIGIEAHIRPGASDSTAKNWFSSHFGWTEDKIQADMVQDVMPSPSLSVLNIAANTQTPSAAKASSPAAVFSEHEGLWVTLTPTSMSTSPFFDTLLVLVVSPLLTLTVVYALLLLRSRIRRRRWRAPKSVVERLPVRTYHTISTSSSTSSTRSCSPGSITQTSPLLGNERRRSPSRPVRSRSQTIAGAPVSAPAPREEKSHSVQSGSTLWRRKYTGRQVECVVCLEEYVDGQSRVMRLPCGHEFHAECITPWLTTRRRTCPICKGDVVRSLAHTHDEDSQAHDEQPANTNGQEEASRLDSSSAPVLIVGVNDDGSDAEQNAGLLDGRPTSAPQSSWRHLASFSLSALSGDTIWHQARADRNR